MKMIIGEGFTTGYARVEERCMYVGGRSSATMEARKYLHARQLLIKA